MNRRELLAGAGCVAGLACAPDASASEKATTDAAVVRALEVQLQSRLARDPELMTELGLDTGEASALRGVLRGRSRSSSIVDGRLARDQASALRSYSRLTLSPDVRLDVAAALFVAQGTSDRLERFPYHVDSAAYSGPYPVSPASGSHLVVPVLLEGSQPVVTKADAEAWVSRLERYAIALDEETERVAANAAGGVVLPPDLLRVVLDRLIKQRDTAASETRMLRVFRARSTWLSAEALVARAVELIDGPVKAALARQVEQLRLAGAGDPTGRLPDGDQYYAALLAMHTTTSQSPDSLHAFGMAQVEALSDEIDAVLRSRGEIAGSVEERLARLALDPAWTWPNDEAGRAAILAALQQQMASLPPGVQAAYPESAALGAPRVTRLARAWEDAAVLGGYSPASLDGSRAAIVSVNLRDTADWPKWRLASFGYHEGRPGHHLQAQAAGRGGTDPLYRRLRRFTAFEEGWAAHAERVVVEVGTYEADSVMKLGYLHGALLRAKRLIADTGLHAKGWSRTRALSVFGTNDGSAIDHASREIDRCILLPGHASAYAVGAWEIHRLQTRAQASLGARFSLCDFHGALLRHGQLPLNLLDTSMSEWAQGTLAPPGRAPADAGCGAA